MGKVQFERDGALGTVTLENPPLNQIDDELVNDLGATVSELEAADGLRAVLLRGSGDVFSAGADVTLFEVATQRRCGPLWPHSSTSVAGSRVSRSRRSRPCTGSAWRAVWSWPCSAT